jgi:hypothetical protein
MQHIGKQKNIITWQTLGYFIFQLGQITPRDTTDNIITWMFLDTVLAFFQLHAPDTSPRVCSIWQIIKSAMESQLSADLLRELIKQIDRLSFVLLDE